MFSSFKFSFNKLFRLTWRLENFFKIENWNISCKCHMQEFVLLTNKFSIYSLILQSSLTEKWACFLTNQDIHFFQIAENSRIQTIHYSVCKDIVLKVFRGTHWLLNKPIQYAISLLQYEERNLSNQGRYTARSKIEFFAATRAMIMAGGCLLLKQRGPC